MATEAEKQKLASIRTDLAMVGAEWSIEADEASLVLVVKDPADGQPRPIATIASDAPFVFQDFLIRAADRQIFLLDMLDRCGRAYRELAAQLPKPKNYSAECAMKCRNDQAFRQFLIEQHNLHDAADFEHIKTRLRGILAIQSLGELNEDPAAAGRWRSLVKDFERWRSQP